MLCVAADSWVCDPDGMVDRLDKWQWTHSGNDLTDIHLARKTNTSFRSDAQSRGLVQDQSSRNGEISIQSVTGPTTGNNQASIACMIIWPHAECDVSLYIGGDLGDEMEEQILRWSTIPSATDTNVRIPPRVDCLKLSHHGMSSESSHERIALC